MLLALAFILIMFILSVLKLKGALAKNDIMVIGLKEMVFVSALTDLVIIEEFALRNTYKGKTKYGNGTLTIDRVRSGETSYDRKVLVKKLKATTEYRRVAEDSKRINAESTKSGAWNICIFF